MLPVVVPPDWVNTTVDPLVVRLLPAASFACSVSVTTFPDATLPAETVTSDCKVEMGPGVTVIVGSVDVTVMPPIVAPIVVALPLTTPLNVAE